MDVVPTQQGTEICWRGGDDSAIYAQVNAEAQECKTITMQYVDTVAWH